LIVPIDPGLPRRVQLIDFILGTLGSNKRQFNWDRGQGLRWLMEFRRWNQ